MNEREQKIIKLRYGIDDKQDDPKTLEFIGDKLNVTRERIRQIENKTLQKLRRCTIKIANSDELFC